MAFAMIFEAPATAVKHLLQCAKSRPPELMEEEFPERRVTWPSLLWNTDAEGGKVAQPRSPSETISPGISSPAIAFSNKTALKFQVLS